ncbi:MAG: GxxExxY protein [Roseibacillus sp.]
MEKEVLYRDEVFKLIGACIEVHREKGHGFLEPVYHECLELEAKEQQLPLTSKPKLELYYKGHLLTQRYEPDFVGFSKIIVEIKAAKALDNSHRAQTINYLKATGFRLALLVNFGSKGRLEWERFIN